MRSLAVAALCLIMVAGHAEAAPPLIPHAARLPDPVPLPRPRPQPPAEPVPDGFGNLGVPSIGVGPEPQPPSACFLALTSGLAEAEPVPPIAQPKGCDALDVVRLQAVNLDRRRVSFAPPVALRCEMATALAGWVRDRVAPAVTRLGAALAAVDNYDSFECRGRNRVAGAKTSEHGRANALDVRALVLEGGRRIALTDTAVDKDFREELRRGACERFTTVLGPGSDGYHEEHIHLDLAERRNGYRLCQWDVRDASIPLPQPRPPEAPQREQL